MITYKVTACQDDTDPLSTKVRVHVGDHEYNFDARSREESFVGAALNAAMCYSRSLGYGMRVLNARVVSDEGGTHTYEITIAKRP